MSRAVESAQPGSIEPARTLQADPAIRLGSTRQRSQPMPLTLPPSYPRCRPTLSPAPDISTKAKSRFWLFSPKTGFFGRTAYGIRTRVTGVRGRRPRPLDERGALRGGCPLTSLRQTGFPVSRRERPPEASWCRRWPDGVRGACLPSLIAHRTRENVYASVKPGVAQALEPGADRARRFRRRAGRLWGRHRRRRDRRRRRKSLPDRRAD